MVMTDERIAEIKAQGKEIERLRGEVTQMHRRAQQAEAALPAWDSIKKHGTPGKSFARCLLVSSLDKQQVEIERLQDIARTYDGMSLRATGRAEKAEAALGATKKEMLNGWDKALDQRDALAAELAEAREQIEVLREVLDDVWKNWQEDLDVGAGMKAGVIERVGKYKTRPSCWAATAPKESPPVEERGPKEDGT